MTRARRLLLLLITVLVFAASRGPLHRATFALPVSNDDAIPLLIARHILGGELATILWNQPYNGTLDAYFLAPGLLLGSAHTVFRLYELICALLLVTVVGLIAGRVGGEGAGWAAAGLAAFGTPYMALMAATGPTPNFLMPLIGAFPMAAALVVLDRPDSERMVWWLLGGLVFGLGLWNSALALPTLVGIGAGLWLAGLRPSRSVLAFPFGFVLGASPLLVARLIGASASSTVTALRPRWLWSAGFTDLAHATSGLLGLEVPLVVDGPQRAVLPSGLGIVLGAGLLTLILVGGARSKACPLWGWALALAVGFAFSRRTGADEVRYLYQLVVPLLTLAGVGLARLWPRSRMTACAFAVTVLLPWGVGHRAVLGAWSDPTHAARVWQVPNLEPVLGSLERARVQSAYASLQFAGRLTLESSQRESERREPQRQLIASQAWNERIPGDPLRFRDEVDLDPQAAWVLSPHLSRGMPRAGGLRDLLLEMGGEWHEDAAGDFVVFRAFRPPFDESRPVPATNLSVATLDGTPLPGTVVDRDVKTAWTSTTGLARGAGLVVRVDPPRRLSALVLAVDIDRTPLAVPWIAEADGNVVRSGPQRYGLQWLNGAPRTGKQGLLVVLLSGREGLDPPRHEIRLIFQGSGPPLLVSEVFLYGPDESPRETGGAVPAAAALTAAQAGRWDEAVSLYAEAVRLDPDRASNHAALVRARWRAAHRRWLDVESLDDGGEELVGIR